MKLKFWQKTYLAILALFFVCLCSVTYATYRVAYRQSYATYIDEALNTQHYILQSLAQDMVALSARRPEAMDALYQYYAEQYSTESLYFEIYQDGALLFDCTPKDYLATGTRPEYSVETGYRIYLVRETATGRRLFSATGFSDSLDDVIVVCNTDMEAFYQKWEQMAQLFLFATGAVSIAFSLVLYIVLSQLYRPLAAVTHTANALAQGERSARAAVTRKDEFGTLAQSMNDMAQTLEAQLSALESASQEKQQMLDHLAHEIRTPLASISGWAETMRDADLNDAEQAEAIETILFESNRMVSLSQQLLKLSLLSHDTIAFTPVNLNKLMTRAAMTLRRKATQKQVTLTLSFDVAPSSSDAQSAPAQELYLQGDETLLESLLLNLVDNAIKACCAHDVVTIAAHRLPQGNLQLVVSDTGHGMQAQTLANIGTPFYREDKARSRTEGGAGLGVSLCMAIAQSHDATLQYESTPEQGTRCIITFTTSTQLEDILEKNEP